MAHSADDRNLTGKYCPSHRLLIKRPQIFQRTTATANNQSVALALPVSIINSFYDLPCSLRALNCRRENTDSNRWKTPIKHRQNIFNRSTRGRGNYANMTHRLGHWLFMLSIKQALSRQLLLKHLKLALQSAKASLFHMFDNQLILAAALIEAGAATHQHLSAIGRLKAHTLVSIAKHSAAHLSLVIFKGKVPVARCRASEVRNFPLHPQHGKLGF